MGCDGYLLKLWRQKKFVVTCHECNKVVNLDNPSEGHIGCIQQGSNGDRLAVDLDFDDYEAR